MVIQQLQTESFPVALLCQTLGVSRSAYYAWYQDERGPRRREDNRLRPLLRKIFWEHQRRYGARSIAAELAARDETCSRRRVGRLMDERGLVAIQPRTFKPRTTDSRHTLGDSDNLLLHAEDIRRSAISRLPPWKQKEGADARR
jgi:transposase InsO family protein